MSLFDDIEYAVLSKAGGFGDGDLRALRQRVESASALAQLVLDIIHSVENRCMACDGPVTPTCDEITDDELRRLYDAAQAIVKGSM